MFVDVLDDFNLDPGKIEAAITPRTRALLPVHYAGQPAKMGPILEIAQRRGLPVVEDACQAISAAIDGRLVSNFGVAAGFSLHPLKNLNVWGDGGVIVTNSAELDAKLRLLRNHGLVNRDEVEIFGYNCRLDTLQAIVGNHLIGDTEAITAARIKNALALDAGLAPAGAAGAGARAAAQRAARLPPLHVRGGRSRPAPRLAAASGRSRRRSTIRCRSTCSRRAGASATRRATSRWRSGRPSASSRSRSTSTCAPTR